MEPNTVIVTGGQGFVGRYLVACLLRRWPRAKVVALGRSDRHRTFTHSVDLGDRVAMAPLSQELACIDASHRYHYRMLDVNRTDELSSMLNSVRPDIVFHLATVLRDSEPAALRYSNVQATETLLSAVSAMSAVRPRVILGSTGGVYGAPRELPLTEGHDCKPVNAYAASKHEAECTARAIAEAHDIELICARIFNPVGAGLDERHLPAHLSNQLARILRGQMEPVVSFAPLDTTRDFVDVRDVAIALCLLAESGARGETYNVASGIETPVSSVWDHLLSLARAEGLGRIDVRIGAPRPSDIPRHFGDIEKIRRLGFRPARSLRDSLRAMLLWYLEAIPEP